MIDSTKKRKIVKLPIFRIPIECLAIVYRFLPEWERFVGIGRVNKFYRWFLKTSNLVFFKIQDFSVVLGGLSINVNQRFPTVGQKQTISIQVFPEYIINFTNVKSCCVYEQDGIFNKGLYHTMKNFLEAMPQLRKLWFIEVRLGFFNNRTFPKMGNKWSLYKDHFDKFNVKEDLETMKKIKRRNKKDLRIRFINKLRKIYHPELRTKELIRNTYLRTIFSYPTHKKERGGIYHSPWIQISHECIDSGGICYQCHYESTECVEQTGCQQCQHLLCNQCKFEVMGMVCCKCSSVVFPQKSQLRKNNKIVHSHTEIRNGAIPENIHGIRVPSVLWSKIEFCSHCSHYMIKCADCRIILSGIRCCKCETVTTGIKEQRAMKRCVGLPWGLHNCKRLFCGECKNGNLFSTIGDCKHKIDRPICGQCFHALKKARKYPKRNCHCCGSLSIDTMRHRKPRLKIHLQETMCCKICAIVLCLTCWRDDKKTKKRLHPPDPNYCLDCDYITSYEGE